MLEFQEKRKLKRFVYSRITFVFLLVLTVFALNSVYKVYKKQGVADDNLTKTAATFDSLLEREKMLSSEIDKLKTESGLEEEIRQKYGLVKPGEEVIVVVDKDKDDEYNTTLPETGLWQKFLNWLQ